MLPPEVEGLPVAIGAAMDGADEPLVAWKARGARVLIDMLVARGAPRDHAERAVGEVLRSAFEAVRKGREIRNERAWIRTVAWRAVSSYRAQGRDDAGDLDLDVLEHPAACDPAQAAEEANEFESRRRWLRRTIPELPPPYREVAELQGVHGWSRRRIAGYLHLWRLGTSFEQARKMIRRTHEMLRKAKNGRSLHALFRGRYDRRKNPWMLAPPPISTLGK